uniref:transposase n=1 Tax=Streptomyces albiflavescens TaxID=1623582 RepID=UPI001E598489|nr:transposase [Streptomyces albiflavescens]
MLKQSLGHTRPRLRDPEAADRWTCAGTGENRTTQERFECTRCGHTANADQVGALNVALTEPGLACPAPTAPLGAARPAARWTPRSWRTSPRPAARLGRNLPGVSGAGLGLGARTMFAMLSRSCATTATA